MLFERRFWDGIADGSVTLTFRRWRTPQAVAGHRHRTPAGIIQIDQVQVVDHANVSDRDARKAGYESADALRDDLRGDASVRLHRVAFHLVDQPDPRDELASLSQLSPDDVAEIGRRLERMDRASRIGPWTRSVLDAIGANPGTRAADLAAAAGRELVPFKRDVRKLKELGLTISLEVGYRLSPRGSAYLDASRGLRR